MRGLLWLTVAAATVAAPMTAACSTIHVPSDQPTIQTGINAASAGDTVLVACGTYYEHDIEMKSGVRLTSETGEPDCVTIDAQSLGRVMYCVDVDGSSAIAGFTIANGSGNEGGGGIFCDNSSPSLTNCHLISNGVEWSNGGALACTGGSNPMVSGCEFAGNAAWAAGAVSVYNSEPTFTDCVFTGNWAMDGGAMDFGSSSSTLTRCTFLDNDAGMGGVFSCIGTAASPEFICCTFSGNGQPGADGTAVWSGGGASPTLTQCIIAFGTTGPVVFCSGGTVALSCCDIYGNAGGDWVGCIADQYGVDGNFSEDPLFCGDLNPEEPYTLHASSPCAPENNSECGLIGAWGVGCGLTSVEDKSWGAIKSIFR